MRRLLASLVSVFLLAGCAAAPDKNALEATNLDDYYSQVIDWQNCGDDLKCAEISVPLDYSDVTKGSITIAVNRYWKGSEKPKGELLINPGGPGASGYDYVKRSVSSIGTDSLRSNFAIVGFDPRGVQNSSPVKCLDAEKLDNFFYEDDRTELGSEADLVATRKKVAEFIAACQENTGDLLGYVDTESAARDMDVIRALLGVEKLDYLGFSYGTFLGTVYANLFPDRVGRFVLDGAVDPTMPADVQSVTQLKGFDSALKAYLKACASDSECPLKGNLETNLSAVRNFMLGIEGNPLSNSDDPNRAVTIWAVETGMMMALYSESYWTYLNQAFTDALDTGDGTMFQRLADFYNDRDESGKYLSNINEANIAVNCLDSREDSSPEAVALQNQKMLEASPTLGRYWQFGSILCANWPYPVRKTLSDYSAQGTPMIIVVGTTNDPATPYSQAVALANDVLSNGYLITFEGEGHTAYGGNSQCVDDAVDKFFISGEVLPGETRC